MSPFGPRFAGSVEPGDEPERDEGEKSRSLRSISPERIRFERIFF
ncbi:hypothetical protein EKH55_3526 [Sinorhizobium alkalisoli]|nr:hypothetical protein EKH55_3526 [Sinorhizobium alkalisoli]